MRDRADRGPVDGGTSETALWTAPSGGFAPGKATCARKGDGPRRGDNGGRQCSELRGGRSRGTGTLDLKEGAC